MYSTINDLTVSKVDFNRDFETTVENTRRGLVNGRY